MESYETILQFFAYQHLPERLRMISRPFSLLADDMVEMLPQNAERSTALRKLLEAKDCAVRAYVSDGLVTDKVAVNTKASKD